MFGTEYINFNTQYYLFTVKRFGLLDQLNSIPLYPSASELYDSYVNDKWIHETNSGCIWKTIFRAARTPDCKAPSINPKKSIDVCSPANSNLFS